MYKELDFYKTSELLSEEERFVKEAIRKFVEKTYLPLVVKAHRQGYFPTEIIKELGSIGALGVTIPEAYGGGGFSHTIYGLAMAELERGDSGLRSFASVQGSLVMYPIFTYGSENQKKYWLPQLAAGEKIGCFGLTEPDHGSDPGAMETKAEETADGYLINGAKMWITNGSIADVAVIWAKMDGKVHGFLVEKDREGFYSKKINGKYSLRASDTAELVFEDCLIPKENILPTAKGLKAPLSCLNEARYGISWGVIGAAQACYHEALEFSKSRIQFDKPIAAFQLTQHKLVEMLSEITKAQLLALQLGKLKDSGKAAHYHISLAKRNNVNMALEIARSARSILAANGISDEYQTIRHLLNLESVLTYEGTHEVHTLILGEQITGFNTFINEKN
jgi:glutaryl-CoA dehydrogenase